MQRRKFLTSIGAISTGSVVASQPVSAVNPEDLWLQKPQTPPFESIANLINEFLQSEDVKETEDESLRAVSDTIRETGQPLENKYGETIPEMENQVNNAYDIAHEDVRFVLSILESLEEMYGVSIMPIARTHISIASKRAFLIKSLVSASLNFYNACGEIEQAPESKPLSSKLKWNFYISLLILIAEIVLVKYPFDYKIAWKGTRYIHNQFLVRMRSILGPRAIGLIMTGVHWLGIRRQVSVSFGKDLGNTVQNLYQNKDEIYQETVSIINSVDEDFNMDRLDWYSVETKINVGYQSSIDFLIEAILKPLSETIQEFSKLSSENFEALRNGNINI